MSDDDVRFDLRMFIERQALIADCVLHPIGVPTSECCPDCISASDIMVAVGWAKSARLKRVLARGLTVKEADRIATAAGHHPSYYWPNWYRVTVPLEDAS